MLTPNPLYPPSGVGRGGPSTRGVATPGWSRPFVSAEDFDATGILTGMDPCESRYWWVPELHAAAATADAQATSRPASRPAAAA